MPWLFSDFSCFDMSLLLLTVTLRGVPNKHCLLSFFSLNLCHSFSLIVLGICIHVQCRFGLLEVIILLFA